MKRIWIALSVTCLCLTLAFTLASCDKGEAEHVHDFSVKITAPTCTTEGYTTYTCKADGCTETYTDGIVPALMHQTQSVSALAATCTEDGHTAGERCTREGCTYNTVTEQKALGHEVTTVSAKEATCTEAGYTEHEICSREGCTYSTKVEIPAHQHQLTQHAALAATCTTAGHTAYETCSRAGCTYTTYSEIPPLQHQLTQHSAVPATCTTAGNTAYETCSRSGCTYTTFSTIPALQHQLTYYPETAATCTTDGHNAYEACSRTGCGYTTKVTRPALNHQLMNCPAQEPTCTLPGCDAFEICLRPGCLYSTRVDIPALKHQLTQYQKVDATCTTAGHEAYESCSRPGCGYSTFVEIPALNHAYEHTGWIWEDDFSSAKATFVCTNDPTHTTVAVANITTGYAEATCDNDAFTGYYASARYGGETYNDEKYVYEEGTALGHDWELWGYQWSADYSTANMTFKCNREHYHETTVTVGTTSTGKNPTCTINGNLTYTATVTLDGETYTRSTSTTVMASHTLSGNICQVCGLVMSDGLEFVIKNGEAILMGRGSCEDAHVVIPSVYEGYPVTEIDKAFMDDTILRSVVIPSSVVRIARFSFYGCTSLESITIPFVGEKLENPGYDFFGAIFGADSETHQNQLIPSTLTKVVITGTAPIPSKAFYKCNSLIEVVIEDCVSSIGKFAFSECNSIERITIPYVGGNINAPAGTRFGYIFGTTNNFYDVPTSIRVVRITCATYIPEDSFADYGKYIQEFYIPATVTEIGSRAFDGCWSIRVFEIERGSQLVKIGSDFLISASSEMNKIFIPITLESFGSEIFGYDWRVGSYVDIYYEGTAEDWANVYYYPKYNDGLINATIYYYSETEPTENASQYWHWGEDGKTLVLWETAE